MGRPGRELRALLEARGQRRALHLRRQRPPRAPAHRSARADQRRVALLPAAGPPRHGLWLPCPRAVQARGRPPLQPEQAAGRSLCQGSGRRTALGRCAVRLPDGRQARGPGDGPPRQRGPDAQGPRARNRLHLGRRPPARGAVAGHGDLRAPRARLHDDASRRAREPARHLCGAGLRAGGRVPAAAGGHHHRAAAGARLPQRPSPRREGVAELLGLQLAGLLRARDALQRIAQGQGIQDHGQDPAFGRHRGHPGRGLQPHLRRQPAGADALAARRGQRVLLHPEPGQPALLRRLHGLRQHRQPGAPARAAAGHGFAALLGGGDARRRLPLRSRVGRSRVGAGARGRQRSRTWAASSMQSGRTRPSTASSSSPSPGTLAWAATRSATSRRAGPNGTTAYRDGVRGWWKGDPGGWWATWHTGWPPRRTCTAGPARGRTPASTSSRRTMASR